MPHVVVVKSDGLNLHTSSDLSPNNIITALAKGDELECFDADSRGRLHVTVLKTRNPRSGQIDKQGWVDSRFTTAKAVMPSPLPPPINWSKFAACVVIAVVGIWLIGSFFHAW